jgi:hypothetical protein
LVCTSAFVNSDKENNGNGNKGGGQAAVTAMKNEEGNGHGDEGSNKGNGDKGGG